MSRNANETVEDAQRRRGFVILTHWTVTRETWVGQFKGNLDGFEGIAIPGEKWACELA